MDLSEVEVPDRPAALVEVEQRHREIRRQRQELEAALRAIETELSRRALGQGDDEIVARLVSGDLARLERDTLPEEARDIRRRLEVIVKADQELAQKLSKERERYANQIARAYRAVHREATRRIALALRELVAANEQEEAIHLAVPGIRLDRSTFPNCGKLGPHGGPVQFWFEFARRLYPDLEEPDEPAKPKGAGRLVPRRAAKANGAAAEPVSLVAKGSSGE